MKGKKRSELALKSFRAAAGGPRALILPIKSGSHGLNLVQAHFRGGVGGVRGRDVGGISFFIEIVTSKASRMGQFVPST